MDGHVVATHFQLINLAGDVTTEPACRNYQDPVSDHIIAVWVQVPSPPASCWTGLHVVGSVVPFLSQAITQDATYYHARPNNNGRDEYGEKAV